ncbi:MAG: lysophospholipid acyltransferase family protein [Gammaproteobacteria bacterium]|nr:lysophospholipid acyltransferase family protein [Gammaproteobacteria bacterium]
MANAMYFTSRLKPSTQRLKLLPAWLAIGALALMAQLPGKLRLAFGAQVGRLFYLVNAKRRRIAHINLELCFPHWPLEKRRQVIREHFKIYGQAIVDLGMVSLSSEERLNAVINIEGFENYRRVRNAGHAVIFLTPHLVGVDIAGTLLSRHLPVCTMMRDHKNPVLNNRLKANRKRFGLKLYTRSQGLLPLVQNLKKKVSCYYIADEDFGVNSSIFVPFFGVPVATLNTLGRMARLTDAKVLPVRSYLDSKTGRYDITIEAPLENFPTDDSYTNARRMNAIFENMIAAAPEQYLWTLRWFKSRPDNGTPPY